MASKCSVGLNHGMSKSAVNSNITGDNFLVLTYVRLFFTNLKVSQNKTVY